MRADFERFLGFLQVFWERDNYAIISNFSTEDRFAGVTASHKHHVL